MKKMLFTGAIALFTLAALSQPTAGLVGYWPMDGNFNDLGPYNIAGTNVGGCTASTNSQGVANKAMAFSNPTSTVVQYGTHAINNNVNFSGTQDFTYTFSFYINSPYVHHGGLYDNNLNYGGPGIWYWNSPGYLALQFNYKNASVGTASGVIALGNWMKIACVRSSGTLKVYVDGTLRNSTTEGGTAPAYANTAKFGTMWYQQQTPPGYNGCHGKMDEFRIYNRALTQQEITDLYVLPITLNSFTATKVNTDILLNWQTATEQNCDHFNVQRSIDGSNFATVGQVRAAGNTSSLTNYQFTDLSAKDLSGIKTVFYRLETVDVDAKRTYSSIVSLKLNDSKEALVILQNPAVSDLRMQVLSGEKRMASFIVTDAQGRRLITKQIL